MRRPITRSAQWRLTLLLVVLGLVVTGCGTKSDPPPDNDEGVPAADLGPSADDDDVVLRYGFGGGLLPPLVQATERPEIVLFGDGTLLQDVTASGRGGETPAVPVIEERRLDADAVTVLAGLLEDAAVTEERDYGFPMIADAGGASLQVRVDGELVVNGVEAPGFEEDLSSNQLKERARFEELVERLTDVDATLGLDAPEPVVAEFDRWLVFSENVEAPAVDDRGEGSAPTVGWPLDPSRLADDAVPLVCTELSGADIDTVLTAAMEATGGTVWSVVDGGFVRIGLHPVTEGQTCAGQSFFTER